MIYAKKGTHVQAVGLLAVMQMTTFTATGELVLLFFFPVLSDRVSRLLFSV